MSRQESQRLASTGARPEAGARCKTNRMIDMKTKKDYKQLCYAPFVKGNTHFPILVHTGRHDDECRPLFKTVLAEAPVKVNAGGKILWGISCYDAVSGESMWYGYNDCVSLEGFDVLRRMLDSRYAWMKQVDGMREETILLAKAQLKEGR